MVIINTDLTIFDIFNRPKKELKRVRKLAKIIEGDIELYSIFGLSKEERRDQLDEDIRDAFDYYLPGFYPKITYKIRDGEVTSIGVEYLERGGPKGNGLEINIE